ncbi:MAG: class I SAM-dependent methyltransferase [Planctomycetota bacterium]
MDDSAEVELYGKMDHHAVNSLFVEDLLSGGGIGPRVIDLGCGTGQIPVLLCQRVDELEVLAIDASIAMLEAARIEIELGGVQGRIFLENIDCKRLSDLEEASCQTLISNSLIHHLEEPTEVLRSAMRLIEPGGRMFLRDLLRPSTDAAVEALIEIHASDEPPLAQQLLRQSLHAALNEDELMSMVELLGLPSSSLQITSDRHWTLDARIEA